METIGTRELKQNPQAIIKRVLESGEAVEVTTYGNPTEVSLVPDTKPRGKWVRPEALAAVRPLSRMERDAWHADLAEVGHEVRHSDVADPWGPA